ncbi:alpha/beta fold hydrolase [Mycolicibacterium rhodesiae]|uniref:Alpha/beta hydrolase n=1 Tax=Mycolicibacterium rhodesiae TaxID=36814 RepID=A0A1X0IPD2_MYCRH|nr:alpha/beta hydrolase [Mycolicibacterium rhodesiae]MCV7344347.1 alpha/beta hydrolase [Mycolicibacterium rhodesiae]ORB50207.1 alpha/beta hydrolase [Mycolicibacterium rhodesiae]
MPAIHHRFAVIDGHRVFYREAGPVGAPILVLLHGFPTSSSMFRNLLPLLADRWHLIAPDHLGFGLSDAPPADEFTYTFDALTDLTAGLLRHLGVHRYAMYVHDYGAPIGWRLALRDPASIAAIITQNGNAYQEGFQPDFFRVVWAYWAHQNTQTEEGVRQALTLEMTRWQYLTGVDDETLIDPTTWITDHARLSRPGNDLIQLALFRDYASNPPLYAAVHDYFRASGVPLLAVWGRNDPVFGPHGAAAFKVDLPNAEIHLIDGGHFLLESALDETLPLIRTFLTANL